MGQFDHPVEWMNCTTGEMESRPATDEEIAQRKQDAKDAVALQAQAEKDAAAAEKRRKTVLDHLAKSTGLTPDEIREALNA